MTEAIRVIGWKAHAALARDAGRVASVAGFADSPFRAAGGEPIWIGTKIAAMHPRAVVLREEAERSDRLECSSIAPWRLAPLTLDRAQTHALREGCVRLAGDVLRIGSPRGFAAFFIGEQLSFPLDHALENIEAFAEAIGRDDAQTACTQALPLLGLGAGLTPSGDDFVGAALYARRLVGWNTAWDDCARRLVHAATTRTHAIGAALFRDLTEGESFAALHRLAATLAARKSALAAARELVAIGHSSGWDMLAGFIVGATGRMGSDP